MPDAEVPASGHPSDMGGQPRSPEEDASSEGSSDGATGRDVLVGLAEQVRALSTHMQTMLQDMAVFNSRLAQQEAATRATPWAPGPARAAAAMHDAPPHGVDVGACIFRFASLCISFRSR